MIDGNAIVKRVQAQQADPSWQVVSGKDRTKGGFIGKLLGFKAPILVLLADGFVIYDASAQESWHSKISAFDYGAVLSLKSVPRGKNVVLVVNEEQHRRYKDPPIEIVLEQGKWDDPHDLARRIETAWQSYQRLHGYTATTANSGIFLGGTPPLQSLFVFDARDQAFVEGKTNVYENVSYGPGIAITIVGTILVSFFVFFVDPLILRNISPSSSLTSLAALWANTLSAITLLVGILWFRRTYRLKNQAQRLYGEIVTCRAEVDHTSSAGENETSVRYYKLQVRYRFRTPDGVDIVKKTHTDRDDLEGKSLPGPGTPVAVQYVSHRLFELL
jgi:hypothetical protein